MSGSIFANLSYVAFGISFLLVCVAIFLFFKFKIKAILDELSGHKEQREIKEYRKQRTYQKKKSSTILKRTERVTERIAVTQTSERTAELKTNPGNRIVASEATALLDEGGTEATALLDEGGTAILEEAGTTVLDSGTTTLMDSFGTTVLENTASSRPDGYCVILNEVVIHTMEYI